MSWSGASAGANDWHWSRAACPTRGCGPFARSWRTANGTYACVCDDGEGITLDPTGHRTTIEIPLDKKREVRGLQRTHRIAEAPAPAPSTSEPSLGFDIDESREVARVDPGSWAEELGIAHGWVLKSVDKNRIADHQSFVDAALTIARVRRKGSVQLEFEVPSFELCKPCVEYHTGQRLTVLYHGRWRDAMTLKKPWEEHPRVEERHRHRLRVFMNRSLVETCVLGLNHMNHALLFGEAPDNEAAYRKRGEKNAQNGATCSSSPPSGAGVYQGRSAANGGSPTMLWSMV